MLESHSGKRFISCPRVEKSVMNLVCENIDDSGIHIVFLVSSLNKQYPAFSVTPKVGLSGLSAGEKNSLQRLRLCSQNLLRSENPQGSRPLLWGHAHLPGCGSPASAVPKLPYGKARDTGMAGRNSLLYETICLLCGPSLPRFDPSGRGQRSALELEDGQGVGEAIYAGAAPEGWGPGAEGDWNRRGFDPQRPRLPHCGERFGEGSAHLVWGERPFGRESGSLLSVVGFQEESRNLVGGHGHVEGFPELDPEKCAASGHSF